MSYLLLWILVLRTFVRIHLQRIWVRRHVPRILPRNDVRNAFHSHLINTKNTHDPATTFIFTRNSLWLSPGKPKKQKQRRAAVLESDWKQPLLVMAANFFKLFFPIAGHGLSNRVCKQNRDIYQPFVVFNNLGPRFITRLRDIIRIKQRGQEGSADY